LYWNIPTDGMFCNISLTEYIVLEYPN
jgi:hypothetical protein